MRINWLRYPKTLQEKAVNNITILDEDIQAHRIRIRRSRIGYNLPDVYDDRPKSMKRSWKAYRQTQYHVKEVQ
jgi:hypothetical protein